MRDLGNIILHIPAREGSKRVPRKNIRDMAGSPMISYAIKAAEESCVTKNIYINTDAQEIIEYIEQAFQKVNIHKRKKSLANDKASSDLFNMDIIEALDADTLIMINPVCPLIEAEDIRNAVKAYKNANCDTLITCSTTHMQTFCNDQPVNIDPNEELAPSQNNPIIQVLNWAITIWDAKLFKQRYETLGYASMGINRILYPIDHLKSFKVSEEKDFKVCESLILSQKQ